MFLYYHYIYEGFKLAFAVVTLIAPKFIAPPVVVVVEPVSVVALLH